MTPLTPVTQAPGNENIDNQNPHDATEELAMKQIETIQRLSHTESPLMTNALARTKDNSQEIRYSWTRHQKTLHTLAAARRCCMHSMTYLSCKLGGSGGNTAADRAAMTAVRASRSITPVVPLGFPLKTEEGGCDQQQKHQHVVRHKQEAGVKNHSSATNKTEPK